MVICTVCAANHLPKAACLEQSLVKTQSSHTFLVCLVERDCGAGSSLKAILPNIITASELGINDFNLFMFRHNSPYEACCAVKAQLLLWALEQFPGEDEFVYLDPDIRAYSRFHELESMLETVGVILTPHFLRSDFTGENILDDLARTFPCGLFNAGFLAIRRSPVAMQFLHWWNRLLQLHCVGDIPKGFYFDQRWLDLATTFFDIGVLREAGYNVAHWNIYERILTEGLGSAEYFVNGRPLRFFHFSMIDSGRDMFYFKKYLDDDSPLFTIRTEYMQETLRLGGKDAHRIPWSYESYLSGEPILSMARNVFRPLMGVPAIAARYSDPFLSSNAEILGKSGRALRLHGAHRI